MDQIAAGEVVERPASIAKELVENAVDAGATRIRLEVRDGGAAWLAVTDDGCGMTPEDARLALQRHATSKLHTAEDLHGIASFGFRGEALPAIASVSRLRLRTRPADASEAYEIRVEAGETIHARAVGGPPGTRVEVADLFFNVPARRKFLKKASTEWGHVADGLARAALALPQVHFDVQRDDRAAIAWPAVRDPLDRIAAVLSEREAAALVRVDGEEGRAALAGFASRPDHHRPNAAGIYLFVNGRPVRDRLMRHALLEVYRDVLPRGRFPTALLFLSLPPEAVDVNVHPAKWEVRFADPQAVHRLISRSLAAGLASRAWLGPVRGPAAAGWVREPSGRAREGDPRGSDWVFAGTASSAPREGPAPATGLAARAPDESAEAPLRFASQRLLGQLHAAYLLAETPHGLLVVDQHAAHERILYEHLRGGWLGAGVERQSLLLTQTLELPPSALTALADAADAVAALGFDVEPFGADAVLVRAVPALLSGRDPAALVSALADELEATRSLGATLRPSSRSLDEADRIFASLACHSARRQGDRLDEREQRALLEGLDAIPWAPTCPHGRPVAIWLERDELERRFARR
ncbi:MAG: DNA mismatch repair endonuclease MutL [Deltaproteobacteria bacterium]|nr:MAG: DNA mismatch repair endonuclease MutL [Deltaproteobacteria bacterium]